MKVAIRVILRSLIQSSLSPDLSLKCKLYYYYLTGTWISETMGSGSGFLIVDLNDEEKLLFIVWRLTSLSPMFISDLILILLELIFVWKFLSSFAAMINTFIYQILCLKIYSKCFDHLGTFDLIWGPYLIILIV